MARAAALLLEAAVPWGRLAVAAVAGYLAGSVSPSALVARARGVDLRGSGSGNPGATNAGRVMGRRVGVVVGLLDVLKGLLPALVLGAWAGGGAAMVAGLAAVVGHVTSPWLHGRGGKGVATSFGAVLGVAPFWGLLGVAAFGVVVALVRWVALGSVTAAVVVALLALVGWARPGGFVATSGTWWGAASATPGWRLVWATVLAVLIVARHRRNLLVRLRSARTERRGR